MGWIPGKPISSHFPEAVHVKTKADNTKSFSVQSDECNPLLLLLTPSLLLLLIKNCSLFPINCLWNVAPVEAGSTASRERGIFPTPCACQSSERDGDPPCPADQQPRGNGFAGILLPRTSLTSTAPARGKEHHQPLAVERRVTSPIDEDLFRPWFWNESRSRHTFPSLGPVGGKTQSAPRRGAVLGKGMDFLLLQISCCTRRVGQRKAPHGPARLRHPSLHGSVGSFPPPGCIPARKRCIESKPNDFLQMRSCWHRALLEGFLVG